MIQTDIRAKPSRVYRLIGPDLWSAPLNRPLLDHAYELERAGVIDATMVERTFRVVIRDGFVWLDDGKE